MFNRNVVASMCYIMVTVIRPMKNPSNARATERGSVQCTISINAEPESAPVQLEQKNI